MELTTPLGIVIGLVSIIGAMIFKGISFTVFLNPAAFFVIIIGTVATILNSYPGANLKVLGKLFKILFTKSNTQSEAEIIQQMVALSITARKEGLLALEGKAEEIEDPFLRKGVRLIVDGTRDDVIVEILESEIAGIEKRHDINASIFSSAGMYAPTLGVMGAVFGLIAAMSHIDDTDMMAEAISAAFIATILGIFTGYVLWTPFSKKLKVKTQEEIAVKEMVIDGLLSIQRGDSPVMLKERLLASIPSSRQEKLLEELKSN